MQRAGKLTVDEFTRLFQKSRPPNGWGNTIAIAFSGGVDSTCLLHLLHKMKQETDDPNLKGLGLVAIHIDHGFRSKSTQDAQHCENWAKSRSIPLVTCKIPWGEPPFPKLKSLNEHKEEMARLARMQLLFWVMQEKKASTILMAHHLCVWYYSTGSRGYETLSKMGDGSTTQIWTGLFWCGRDEPLDFSATARSSKGEDMEIVGNGTNLNE